MGYATPTATRANDKETEMQAKIDRDFEAAGRQFTLRASLFTTNDGCTVYGAHVTETGSDDLPFNGSIIEAGPGGDAWGEFVRYTNGVVMAVTREAERDAICEHGLSAWLCEGPQHYPADDMSF